MIKKEGLIRIGVLSDTHIPRRAKAIPSIVLEGLKDVDLIIHAGDLLKDYVIYELQEIAPVEAVAGNVDDEYVNSILGRRKIVSVGDCRIGIVHGDGSSGTTFQRVKKTFINDNVDCVVFGHSHIPHNEKVNGVLYFNPGSPTDKRRQKEYSYGIISIQNDIITGEIIYF